MILGAKNPDCEGLRVINKNLALQNFYMTEYVYKYNIDVKNVQVMTNIKRNFHLRSWAWLEEMIKILDQVHILIIKKGFKILLPCTLPCNEDTKHDCNTYCFWVAYIRYRKASVQVIIAMKTLNIYWYILS